MKKPRHSHIFEKDPTQHYVEPSWCSERLFEVERFGPPGSLVVDPAAGWGRIVASARNAGYVADGADIVHHRGVARRDFLKDGIGRQPRRGSFSIVTNPPFNEIEQFCRQSLEIGARKAAFICPLPRLPAALWLQEMPLKAVHLLTPRPSMPTGAFLAAGGKAEGGREGFAWLVFDPAHDGPPTLAWLQRPGKPTVDRVGDMLQDQRAAGRQPEGVG